jgi:hypothetical protein
MRTIQFSVDDRTYAQIKEHARSVGFSGQYAASQFCRMAAVQSTGGAFLDKGMVAILVLMSDVEYDRIHEHVAAKKGYIGPVPEATFMLRSAFDIMAKYPAKPGKEKPQ